MRVRRVMGWAAAAILSLALVAVALIAWQILARNNQETFHLVTHWGGEGGEPGRFRGPIGVAVDDSGYVYVSDSGNDRIQKFDSVGGFVTAWGRTGVGPGELRRPMHITLGPDGNLYVTEYLNDRIQVFSRGGASLAVIAEDTSAARGELDAPGGLALSADGRRLWIADFYHHRVAVYSREGRYLRSVGESGRVLAGRLHYPTDVVRGEQGFYVADAYNHRIQLFSPDGDVREIWGGPLGTGVPGPWRGWFRVATGVGLRSADQVYVADFYNHRVQKFGPGGQFQAEWGGSGTEPGLFDRPTDVQPGPNGRIYVVDFGNHRVQVFRASRSVGTAP